MYLICKESEWQQWRQMWNQIYQYMVALATLLWASSPICSVYVIDVDPNGMTDKNEIGPVKMESDSVQ